jgi:hypothetical protein
MADLSVQFQEPTVGGLTGQQLSLLREWSNRGRCDFEDELNNRCPDATAEGSRFCRFHQRLEDELNFIEYDPSVRDAHEPTYDEYDSHRDREFE